MSYSRDRRQQKKRRRKRLRAWEKKHHLRRMLRRLSLPKNMKAIASVMSEHIQEYLGRPSTILSAILPVLESEENKEHE